jgi:DNA polymerase-3 subunit gamma/tau
VGKALYRKYRSQNLAEIIGQGHITETLAKAIQSGKFSHAYLFTGPRGVGKTSVARILAHEINGLSYVADEPNHLDIIEIDAASNRRIDEIRDLRTNMHVAPTSAKYKVYIIDEVHMLTKEAFNALLKSLEEPPAHVIFILATTEEYKVPETIVSRTQRFSFKPITIQDLSQHLKDIAKKENIKISDAAINLIAEHGSGSFRDTISLLDQIRHSSESIDVDDVLQSLGLAKQDMLDGLAEAIKIGSVSQLANLLEQAKVFGLQPAQLAKQLSKFLQQNLLSGSPILPAGQIIKLLDGLARIGAHPQPSLGLEILLYEYALINSPEPQPNAQSADKPIITDLASSSKGPKLAKKAENKGQMPSRSLNAQSWAQVLELVKKKHNTLYGLIRMANPEFAANDVTLKFAFGFHQKRLSELKNQELLKSIIKELLDIEVNILSIIDNSQPLAIAANNANTVDNADLVNISNIFDGAEVVDS